MKQTFRLLLYILLLTVTSAVRAQVYNQIDESGNVTQRSDDNGRNRNFNPHNNDTTKSKEIPRGLHVWTIDRRFGDIRPAEIDTMPHLFMRTAFNEGRHGEYNTTGNNYTARQNRIFIDRREDGQFIFTQPYSFVNRQPDEFHFTNTLSPLTNMSYYSCGDKTDGEDRIDAKFAVNANKRLGGGFDLDYAYARGYFSNQNTSHFGATLFSSYLGDRYQMHLLLSTMEQKTSENGGIEGDDYITHPESISESYSENEIPTILSSNWNRNNHQHVFLTHRYSFGFYRKTDTADSLAIAQQPADSLSTDSINGEQRLKPAATDSVKPQREYVPVTSFIHTLELNKFSRNYISYKTPTDYYANNYLSGDSIHDDTKHLQLKNTLGVALLEGFNKYAKAGLKAFIAHELRTFELPDTIGSTVYSQKWTEHNVSVGGKLSKTEGHTLHYNVTAELCLAGEDAGQLKTDFATDLNFRFLGDTVQLAASAYFYRLNPVFYQRHYHSHNFWWDSDDMSKETRTRIEGRFTYKKTNTQLRVAIEEIQNYTYYGMSYDHSSKAIKSLTAGVFQHGGNINLMTAQLCQDFKLGPFHWDNILTYQSSSDQAVLPLPTLNIFTNLYLHFKVAGVLSIDLGADATFFTKYYAPDFCPQLNQFAVQNNVDSRVKLGGFPFVNVYANMHLKRARFFIMMSNAANGTGNRMTFLAPHYPTNSSVIRTGISWNFYN
jgi:hypothetical protein